MRHPPLLISLFGLVSLVEMMSEVVVWACIVVVCGVIDVLAMGLRPRVAGHSVIGIVWEENSVPCAMLLVFLELFIAERLIVSLAHGFLGDIHLFLGDHGRVWAEVWAHVPVISLNVATHCVHGKGESSNHAGAEEPPSEGLASLMSGVDIGEVMNKSLHGYNGDTTLASLCTASHPHSKWRSEESSNQCVCEESELILVLVFPLVLPGPSLRTGHVLSETGSDPWITQELLFQPIALLLSECLSFTYQSMYSSSSSRVGSRGGRSSKTALAS